jgi:hypothetical protein
MIENTEDDSLPETLNLTKSDLETYWNIWTLWRATDRKFLPSQLMVEPERPLRVMLELDSAYTMIERQEAKRKSKQKDNE